MPFITLYSDPEKDGFPGVQFAGGVPYLASGSTYEVTPEQLAAIQQQYNAFPPTIRDRIKLQIGGVAGEAIATAVAVEAPPPPPAVAPEPEPEAVPDVAELSDDDSELVDIEISKLLGKTVKEAEPILIATAGNVALPRLLRVTYLERIVEHDDIQKALKETALKLVEQI